MARQNYSYEKRQRELEKKKKKEEKRLKKMDKGRDENAHDPLDKQTQIEH